MPASPHPRLAGADWLQRPETQAVFEALAAAGFAARAVGGAVRNALIGTPVTDVDIATTARPQETMAAAEAAGLKCIPTGMAHGTVTVVSGHYAYEVTTLRKDVETHGRHATVAFTDDWAADAGRRDFTINALYCSAAGDVFDPLGGCPDLVARRVRFIGDPAQRIREDYLRILRFFRLTAAYGEGPPDPAGLAACVREREGLAILSAERVRQELLRLLAARRAAELVAAMFGHGLITLVLSPVPRPERFARVSAIEDALGCEPDPVLRLAALAVEVPEDAQCLRQRLRLSNDEAARLERAAEHEPDIGPTASEAAARAFLYRSGKAAYRQHLLLAWARSGDAPESKGWRQRLALPERWQVPRFPLGGADVLALGVAAGPGVGELLRTLEDWWIAHDFTAGEPALRARLAELAGDSA